MTVYIVWHCWQEMDSEIDGVFSTLEAAEAFRQTFGRNRDAYTISAWDVDGAKKGGDL